MMVDGWRCPHGQAEKCDECDEYDEPSVHKGLKGVDIHRSEAFARRSYENFSDEIGKRSGIHLIKYAAWLADLLGGSVADKFSAEEWLRIASCCERSEWDFVPGEWTARQLEEAATRGVVPRWDDDERPIYETKGK